MLLIQVAVISLKSFVSLMSLREFHPNEFISLSVAIKSKLGILNYIDKNMSKRALNQEKFFEHYH